jgi:hypothetical protein
MKKFITMLLAIALTACATTRQVYVPTEGYAIDVNEGDWVNIVMIDGKKHNFQVTHVDEIGLSGSEGSFAYSEMQVVNVKKNRKPPKALWWLLLSLAVIAVFAEADDNGSGPLCLYASTDPSRTCL